MAKIDYGNSLSTAGQFPLDGKRRFKTISDMQVLGTNAFKYYEDMIVQCIEDHKQYIWRERLDSDEPDAGVVQQDYTYPTGAVADGINYAGRSFNFFEFSSGEQSTSSRPCFKFHDGTLEMCNVDTIINTEPLNFSSGGEA